MNFPRLLNEARYQGIVWTRSSSEVVFIMLREIHVAATIWDLDLAARPFSKYTLRISVAPLASPKTLGG